MKNDFTSSNNEITEKKKKKRMEINVLNELQYNISYGLKKNLSENEERKREENLKIKF